MSDDERAHERWAHLRFSIVGSLLASPPAPGELRAEIERLAERPWRHPQSGNLVRFAASTIERWYYAARAGANPVAALRRKLREDSGRSVAITDNLARILRRQYEEHPSWSFKLHLDNLVAWIESASELGSPPSYPTLRRFMVAQGLRPRRKRRQRGREIRVRQDREVHCRSLTNIAKSSNRAVRAGTVDASGSTRDCIASCCTRKRAWHR
jgi:putative transposase